MVWGSAVWGQGTQAVTLVQLWRRGRELLGRGRAGLSGPPACACITWIHPPTASVAPISPRGHGPLLPQGNGVIRAPWAACRVRRQRRHGGQRGREELGQWPAMDAGMSRGEKSRMGCLALGSSM